VLKHYEDRYPEDKRPREAIQAALKWAKDPTEANRAAANAAYVAAAAAAAAAYAADAAAYAADAANADAAYAAADAANAAADAAREKEREWQSDRLLELLKDSRPGRKEES
jgi:hypothetical protein